MRLFKTAFLSLAVSTYLLAINPVSSLTAQAPHNSTNATNDTSVVFTFTPPADDAKYYYKVDTNSSNTYADDSNRANWSTKTLTTEELSADSITLNYLVSSDGEYYLHIVAVDASENTSTTISSSKFTIDTTAGTVTMNPAGSAISVATQISMSETESGTIYFTTDGSAPTTASTQYTTPITIAVGATIKAIHVDEAANTSSVKTETYTSTVQPTVKTASDTTAIDGRTFATSSTNLIATATPRTAIQIGGGSTTEGFTRYKYKKSTDTAYTTVSNIATNIDISALSSGSYSYYVLGGDTYNYKSEENKKTVSFTVDNTAPTSLTIKYNNDASVLTVNPANVDGIQELTFSATGHSAIGYKIAATCPTTYAGYTTYENVGIDITQGGTLTDGQTVKVCMAARDTTGNWASTSKTYTIDKTAPTITMPDAQLMATDVTVYLGSTSQTDTIKYTISSASATNTCTSTSFDTYAELSTTYSTSLTVPVSGFNSTNKYKCLYAASSDVVGNKSDVNTTLFTYSFSTATLNVDLVDNSTFATNNLAGATPYTDINITGSNLVIYIYEFDSNGTNTTVTFNSSADNLINLVPLSEGDHNISITGYSEANVTSSSKLRNFTIDNTAPNPFSSSDYNDTNFSTAEYSLTLTKPNGADYMMYSEDNTTYITTSSASVGLTFNKTTTLYTKTKDEAGNMSAIYSATFTQNIPVKTYTLGTGWTLTALPTKTLSDSGLSSAYVWDYNGTAWGNNIVGDSYPDFTSTNSSKGYWVYTSSAKEISIAGDDTSTIGISSASNGWSLLGTTSEITNTSDANITWTYTGGIWSYATTNSELNTTLDSLGYNQINTINEFGGFWIYKQ